MSEESYVTTSRPERRYDIDWIRVFAMLSVFLFHCSRFFDHYGWHVKNIQQSVGMDIFTSILIIWMMPIFFVVSGISSYYALSHQTGGQHIIARIKRLFVPFIFGTFTMIPLQVYFERVSHAQFFGSFIEFYPHYFDGFYAFGGNFAWMGLHLWYLLFLFIFSLLMLPVFLHFKKNSAKGLLSKIEMLSKKPGFIFLPVIPLAVVEILVSLQPDGFGRRDFGGWSLVVYLLIFIYGYFMASNPQSRMILEKNRIPALVIAVLVNTLLLAGQFLPSNFTFLGKTPGFFIGEFLRAFVSWLWIVAILGFGSKYLNFNNKILKYANEAVMPFYILHQTVILTIGFYVTNRSMGILTKYFVICISSFITIMAIYELIIRRARPLRFLFGMKA
jgi:glucan biosynthesis protein C